MLGISPQAAEQYVAARVRLPQVFLLIDGWLVDRRDGTLIDYAATRAGTGAMWLSEEAFAVVVRALEAIGVLRRNGLSLELDLPMFVASAAFRDGTKLAIDEMSSQITPLPARLVAAFPPDMPDDLAKVLELQTTGLRAAIIDLIASCQSHLILASPFWDAETVNDLIPILTRRLEAGVVVEVLARYSDRTARGHPMVQMGHKLAPFHQFRIRTWYDRVANDIWGSHTFHFKAVSIDGGKKAYLGTANLTTSSLRSRFELGTILVGRPATTLDGILTLVIQRLSRPTVN